MLYIPKSHVHFIAINYFAIFYFISTLIPVLYEVAFVDIKVRDPVEPC